MLDLATNRLETFASLEHLSFTLSELWLDRNLLADSAWNREYLKSFGALQVLYLADNPLSSQPDYESMVFSAVPTLQKLDGNYRGSSFYTQRTAGL